ncbi:MAG TPA: heavy-metal-associated domain-containing protein [Bacilli bacterium]|nr:heavy-metal-associated domain-containing protein [Bacilli bacterium]HPZ27272.1 heavy-metal-associated domain-containing protein [Bacilli bacterium]HQC89551.1 heavy-metal-associated domain-containing protein [Bacilli bacterium]
MTNKVFQLETLSCPTCASKIAQILRKTKGVGAAEVAFISSRVKLNYDEEVVSADELKRVIEKTGYKVIGVK